MLLDNTFDPANDLFVGYGLETASVTESPDGIQLPVRAAMPSSFAVVGKMSNTPDFQRNLNNAFGFVVGDNEAAYIKRGARNPEASLPLKLTNIGMLGLAVRDPVTKKLPRFTLVIGRPGLWTICARDCKIKTAAASGKQNTTGEANEIECQISLMACYVHMLATPINPDIKALLAALGDPYFWHDTRQFNVTDSAGVITDFRPALTSWSVNVDQGLIRHGLRCNFGDDCELSNTNEFLDEGNLVVTGEMAFNRRTPEEKLTGAKEAQSWGNIGLVLSNKPAVSANGKDILMTLGKTIPTNASMPGVESTARLASNIPFAAKTFGVGAFST